MTDRAALVAAIEADPDSDLPRLVFADWLDDHNEPARAELIRVQCAAQHHDYGSRRRQPLDHRATELLDALDRTWPRRLSFGETYPVVRASIFRGCLHGLYLRGDRFAAHLGPLAGVEPVIGVSLTTYPKPGGRPFGRNAVARLADCPHLRYVTSAYGPHLARLVDSRHLTRLREINLREPEAVPAVADSQVDFPLTNLKLGFSMYAGDRRPLDTARVLAAAPRFATLDRLVLDGAGFGATELRVLMASAHLPRSLTLIHNEGPRRIVRPGSSIEQDLLRRFPKWRR